VTRRTRGPGPNPEVRPESGDGDCVCPDFHSAIELIGKRWSGAILLVLMEGPQRFADLPRAVPGLSDRLLSQRLRELEEAGLVDRRVEPGQPVRVTYELTSMGAELRPALDGLQDWAQRWNAAEQLPAK
jgi:DNA-binding HxlR family transcriptional regulator